MATMNLNSYCCGHFKYSVTDKGSNYIKFLKAENHL